MKNKKRTVYLINPRFQLQFMGWMLGLLSSVIAIFHLSHIWFFQNLRLKGQQMGLPVDHAFFTFVQDRNTEMNIITAVTFVVLGLIIIIFSLLLSHRIAGPLHRMKRHFEEVSTTGNHRPFSFRKGDYFQELPQAYNQQFKTASTQKASNESA